MNKTSGELFFRYVELTARRLPFSTGGVPTICSGAIVTMYHENEAETRKLSIFHIDIG